MAGPLQEPGRPGGNAVAADFNGRISVLLDHLRPQSRDELIESACCRASNPSKIDKVASVEDAVLEINDGSVLTVRTDKSMHREKFRFYGQSRQTSVAQCRWGALWAAEALSIYCMQYGRGLTTRPSQVGCTLSL